MINPFDVLLGIFKGLDLNLAFMAFGVLVLICIMTQNYTRLRNEEFRPDLLEGEKEIDKILVDGPLSRTHTLLTNRRVLQLRLSWFLSRRRQFAVSLADLRSVVWRRQTNWILLIAAFLCLGIINPLAFLLFLLAVEGKAYSVRFLTPMNEMPWTRMGAWSFRRKQLTDFTRFFRNAQATWAHVRSEKAVGEPTAQAVSTPGVDSDFVWGRPLWVYVLLMLVFRNYPALDGASSDS